MAGSKVVTRKTQYDKARIQLRDSLWKDAPDRVWDRASEDGFVTLPRTLPLIATLIKFLGRGVDPSRTYLSLWFRQRDHGFVEILDAEELAAESGFSGTRKVRSLNEALDQLDRLGFIRVATKGTRKHAFILILHPHDVVQRLYHEDPNRIPEWWWSLFRLRIQDIKATLRWKPPRRVSGPDEDFEDFPTSLDEKDEKLPF